MHYFQDLHPVFQVLLATLFTWGMTALGAGLVFTSRQLSRKALDGMLGFAAGAILGFVVMMVLDVALG